MNLNEEIPDEIVVLAECYKVFSDVRLASAVNPFANISGDTIEFHNTRRHAEYSEALDKCKAIIQNFIKEAIHEFKEVGIITEEETTGKMFADCAITKPYIIPPVDYIKARLRVSAEELYKVYELNTRSERTVLSNTLCKMHEGIIKKKSNGKLYFLYQP